MSTAAKHTTHHTKHPHEADEPAQPSEHDEVTPHQPPPNSGYNPPQMGGATQTYQMTSTQTATFTAWEYYHAKMIH